MMVSKDKFIQALEEVHADFTKEYNVDGQSKRVWRECQKAVDEVRDKLKKRAEKWLLPSVPERVFTSAIHKECWYHIMSDKYKDKFHNTVTMAKEDYIRAVRFRFTGKYDL